MKKLLFVAFFIAGITLVSCNKNQKAVKMLDGDWETVKVDGNTVPDSNRSVLKFESCKLKKEEYCNATLTYPDGTIDTYDYKVTDDGNTLVQKVEFFGLNLSIESDIVELTDTKLILETSIDTSVQSTTTEYQKL